MANKNTRDGEFLRNRKGYAYANLGEERDKCYAVIVKCGHCGTGYYIPIMFTTRSNSISNAIEEIKMTPRVKREKTDCIIDAFEVTELEKFMIDSVNDHDPYLKGHLDKNSDLMERRRIALHWQDDEDVKTAEEYHDYDVLARCFAPRKVGSKLVVPSRVNKDELLQEFFKWATIRCGFNKGNDPFFMVLYYLQYGANNDLGINLDGNMLTFKNKYSRGTLLLDEKFLKYVDRFGLKEIKQQEEEYFSGKTHKPLSRTEKFQARMERFRKHSESSEKTDSEQEPGDFWCFYFVLFVKF